MDFSRKKYTIYILWIVVLLLGPLTVLINTPKLNFNNPVFVMSFFQRITGLLGFSFIFIQLIFGALMSKLTKYLGGSVHRIHITQGLLAYALFLIHPLLYVAIIRVTTGKLVTFIFPSAQNLLVYELYLTYGRIAFVLATVIIFTAFFRTKPIFRRNWKKIHYLNYAVFYFTSFHAWKVGTDINSFPFSYFFWAANIVISGLIVYKYIYPRLFILFNKKESLPQKL